MTDKVHDEWLSLSGAAAMLGVHPSTVRAWSDKGLLPVHRTQGGHRRYKRSEVALWAQSARQPKPIEPEGILQMAVKNVRIQIAEGNLEAEAWYQKLDHEARIQYRQSARTLFHGLMNYMASADDSEAASEAYSIGYEYASRARRYSLSYVDAARAFLFFRSVLLESMVRVYQEANVPSGAAWQKMLQQIHHFTDEILVSLLETYQALESGK